MKSNADFEKLDRLLGQLRTPANPPKLSFNPDAETTRPVDWFHAALALAAGVACLALCVGLAVWLGGKKPDPIIDPILSTVSSVPSDPVSGEGPISDESSLVESEEDSSVPVPPVGSPVTSVTDLPATAVTSVPAEETPLEPVASKEPDKILPQTAQQIMIPARHVFAGAWDGWLYFINREKSSNLTYYRIQGSTGTTESIPSLPELPWRTERSSTDIPYYLDGPFGIQDDWVYYRSGELVFITCQPDGYQFGGCYVAKKRLDGTEEQKLEGTEGAETGKVFGDWVYYYANGALRRVRVDGTEVQMLVETQYCDTYAVGEEGVFFEEDADTGLYGHRIMRCDLDGSNLTTVWHEPDCTYLRILFTKDDYLYFSQYYHKTEKKDGFFGTNIARVRVDGSGYQLLSQRPEQGLAWDGVKVDGDWLYHIKYFPKEKEGERYVLCRVPLQGGEEQKLASAQNVIFWEIMDGQIYFAERGEQKQDISLYRVGVDGAGLTLLYQQVATDNMTYHGYAVANDVPYVILTDTASN